MVRTAPTSTSLRSRLAAPLALAALLGLLAACAPAASNHSGNEAGSSFIGVGLALSSATADGNGAVVVGIIADSPAARAGVPLTRPPARIVAVDGSDVRDLPMKTIVARIQGPAGAPVTLRLVLADGSTRQFTLTRQQLRAPAQPERSSP